ncbi:hypothetical protein EIK77_006328 [Talaromyces pinophilus]|nr:hypothetical protein EIK77_006328 [Talaromyces pinophilus]
MQSIQESETDEPERGLSNDLLFTNDTDSDSEFDLKLSYDSNHVACKKQVQSKQHSATCFKYRPRGSTTDLGVIHLARNHAWVNPWNPAIASCIRSNHDISWIPTVSKSLSLLYYITNYDDVSPWQMVAKATLLKQSIDKANTTDSSTATDLRGEWGSGSQCSPQTANPTSRVIIQPDCPDITGSSGPMAEEACTYEINDKAPVSIFDNYKLRGPHLASLSLFEYGMLVRTKSQRDAVRDDMDIDPAHPRHGTHVQRIARTQSQVATVTFTGQLTEFQTAEDCIRGGHPTTAAIRNDVAEILLGLFVPWATLLPLFQQHATTFITKRDACAQVWDTVHLQSFAKNIELLRKSKEDCQADAELLLVSLN